MVSVLVNESLVFTSQLWIQKLLASYAHILKVIILYPLFGCHIDTAEQQRALNFESLVSDMCHLIIKNIDLENVNPKDKRGVTLLHLAAKSGLFSVCKLIIDNNMDKYLQLTGKLAYKGHPELNNDINGV